MSSSWFIAKRFLQSRKRGGVISFITMFSILGIALGTAALIIALSILAGFEREIKEKVVAFVTHIQVRSYNDTPLPYSHEKIASITQTIPGIQSISPYFAQQAMIRSKSGIDGILLKGIDPSQNHSNLSRYLKEGHFLKAVPAASVGGSSISEGQKELIISRKIATALNISLGDSVIIFGLSGSATSQVMPRVMKLEVSGIYESGMAEYDDIYAFTTLGNDQTLFNAPGKISGYDVMVKNLSDIDTISTGLMDELGYPHYARTMYQSYRNLFSWIELQKKLSPILLVLIIIVATVNILGTLLMFVVDKVREIGILTTLGATRANLRNIFFLQGIIISLVGIGIGNVLAFLLCFIQQQFHLISLPADIYYMSSVPIEMNISSFVLVSVIAFVLSLVTTYLPSRSASRVDPINAIRFS